MEIKNASRAPFLSSEKKILPMAVSDLYSGSGMRQTAILQR